MPSKALVWFKRDLRLRDHAPLAHAVLHDESVGLYIIEPEWISSQEFDAQHLEFVLQSLAELRAALAQRGLPLSARALGTERNDSNCLQAAGNMEKPTTGSGFEVLWFRNQIVDRGAPHDHEEE